MLRGRTRPKRFGVRVTWMAITALALLAGALASAMVNRARGAVPAPGDPVSAAGAQQCPEPATATRDPANPLGLPRSPGPDPLNGARFYVPGPAHGSAAAAIARLIGLDPIGLPTPESWPNFRRQLVRGPLVARVASAGVDREINELSKVAAEPEVQRIGVWSEGGGPGAIFAQAEKVFCRNLTADPGSIPIINTDFLHGGLGGCPTPAQVSAYTPTFRRRIDELAAATDRRPAVFLLELDAIGSSSCISQTGSMGLWEADLRYEINRIRALPHTVVYVEAGYSDSNSPRYTARILNAVGVRRIRGFFTNDTHQNWTIREVRWAQRISRLTHGAHFIVNTADNGRGPRRNRGGSGGTHDLCNPPGRGLGPKDTTNTGFAHADAFMWTHPPGNSSGCGGGPPGGVFWPARAIGLADRANQRLGPSFPSRPY